MNLCLACGDQRTERLFDFGMVPLTTINLPEECVDAKCARRFPMDLFICLRCRHIFNVAYKDEYVNYKSGKWQMYNCGSGWQNYLIDVVHMTYNRDTNVIIDIGAGDCSFLKLVGDLAAHEGLKFRRIAFEPGIGFEGTTHDGIEVVNDYFDPDEDLNYEPDTITCRHVLEHMSDPYTFLQEIASICLYRGLSPYFIAEVPCISKAFEDGRIGDFIYEHVSHFTLDSLIALFERAGWATHEAYTAYDGEVAIWAGFPCNGVIIDSLWENSLATFKDKVTVARENIPRSIKNMRDAGAKIAYWGGTGKSATFLNLFELYGDRVVDSDEIKVGKFVPGTAQKIEHCSELLMKPVDVIIITTRWRAADIYSEIRARGITYNRLLVVAGEHLIPYFEEDYVKETSEAR